MQRLANNQKAYDALAAGIKSGRLSHAILLEGPVGCGKLAFAKETAQAMLCTAQPAARPCGECRDCQKADKDVHPDILVYEGEGGSRSFHVDTVRKIRAQAHVRPNEGQYKVLILRDMHNMTVQSQNALLKMIEEPPKNVHFILTCENKTALLPTVLSRVSVIALAASEEAEDEPSRYGQAAGLLTALCIGDELDALVLLSAYEKDRQGLLELLELTKTLLAHLLSGKDIKMPEIEKLRRRVTPLQLMRILAIIEELCEAVPGNVNGLLLVTAVCSQIKRVMTDE